MKQNSYMDRAMKSKDPRFARVLGKLGYKTTVMSAEAQAEKELETLSEYYKEKVGRSPHHSWDAAKIKEKLSEKLDDTDGEEE